jgi:hypothetical protein
MGTRSTIALEFADGTVEQVYAHWDGYLSANGKILLEHYSDPFKLQELIGNGGISSLGKDIGVKHEFSCPHKYGSVEANAWEEVYSDMTTFYTRERGESLTIEKFWDFANYVNCHQREEYAYILRNVAGKATWYVAIGEGAFIELATAFATEKETT